MSDCDVDDITVNVLQKYSGVFYIYLDVLNGLYPIIDNVNKLFNCFNMETFFANDTFFNYLMQQAYTMWNDFYPCINCLPDVRMVYLHTPYELVPEMYMNTPSFFQEWIQINQNTKIAINGYVYSNNITYYDDGLNLKTMELITAINGCENGTTCSCKLQKAWYPNGQLMHCYNYVNGKKHGLQQAWCECDEPNTQGNLTGGQQLWYQHSYVDGEKHGSHHSWWKNGNIWSEDRYINGKKHGLQQAWYEDGNISHQLTYVNDKLHGVQKYWRQDGRGGYEKIEFNS